MLGKLSVVGRRSVLFFTASAVVSRALLGNMAGTAKAAKSTGAGCALDEFEERTCGFGGILRVLLKLLSFYFRNFKNSTLFSTGSAFYLKKLLKKIVARVANGSEPLVCARLFAPGNR
ncbi:hypothetical protein ACUUL3_04300 [Thiovibrio sp. JS02]